jgi:tetratricopeptide (TPR) repeat protein
MKKTGRRVATAIALGVAAALVLTAALVTAALGATADARFDAANAAFGAGRFDEARTGLEALGRDEGVSPALLYDLGNAAFRAGRTGEAVLAWERALALAPRDPDVAANLRQARRAAGLPLPEPAPWDRVALLATADGWAWLASACVWLAAALVLARLLGGRALAARPAVRGTVRAATALLVVVAAVAVAGGVTQVARRDRGVVLGTDPMLRVAPYPSATASAPLAAGQVVRVERTHEGYVLVRTEDGKAGWVPTAQLGLVADVAAPLSS